MIKIDVPNRNMVDEKAAAIFDALQEKLGMVPNIYAVTGYSSQVLEDHIDQTNKVGKGSFSMKEKEAIRLAVSEVNGCTYCLAAHTTIAKMNGFTDEDALSFRALKATDTKLQVLTTLAADIVVNRGKPSPAHIEAFFEEGYNEKALIDLVAVVLDITFTNYMHGVTKVPIDFPEVPQL